MQATHRRATARAPHPRTVMPALAAIAAGVLLVALPASAAGQVGRDGFERGRLLGERFLLVRHATVIDGTGGLPRQGVSVLIRNGLIEFVGRVDDVAIPEGTEVVDAGGGWLVPGFIDVHAHARDTAVIEGLLAAGITTARSASSSVRDGVDYRKASGGGIEGPRLFSAGPVIDAPPGHWPDAVLVQSEEEVRAAVREQAAAGVDLVKLYARLPPPLVAAAVQEAHVRGLPVAGELVATSWTEAARAGIDHLSHIVSRSPALLAPEVREEYRRDVSEGRAHPYTRWLELLDLRGPEVQEMLGALLSRDVSVDPMLGVIESVLFCGDPAYADEISRFTLVGRADSAPAAARPLEECVAERWPDDFLERARAAWPKALELVRILHENGVRLAAGSDAPFGRLPAGASFHRELELLSEVGIANRQVLRIATANGAVTLGVLHETGTIEPGKRADMVLLGSDPLEDIRNTRDIEWVMLDAKIYRPAVRDEGGG